jgi:hypothetical protein
MLSDGLCVAQTPCGRLEVVILLRLQCGPPDLLILKSDQIELAGKSSMVAADDVTFALEPFA